MAKAYRLCDGVWEQRGRNGAGTNSSWQTEKEGLEVIWVGRHVLRPNIRPASLSKRGKLHIDIFPQIVDDEPLFIVSQYGAHHVFVPVVFLSQ